MRQQIRRHKRAVGMTADADSFRVGHAQFDGFINRRFRAVGNPFDKSVGDPLTVNDTFIKQITDSAKAAIDKAAEL